MAQAQVGPFFGWCCATTHAVVESPVEDTPRAGATSDDGINELTAVEKPGQQPWAGWSRQISDVTDPLSDVDGGWSRMCTEDVCPSSWGRDVSAPAPGPAHLPPQHVELVLHGGRAVTSAVAASVGDLRRTIVEATGVEPDRVELCASTAGRALLDHEPVPKRVTVMGVERFPGGGVILGRAQFLATLREMKAALSVPHAAGEPEESVAGLAHAVFRRLRQEAQDRAQGFFQEYQDIDAFYCTSAFSSDPEARAVHLEIAQLLARPRDLPDGPFGGDRGLAGA